MEETLHGYDKVIDLENRKLVEATREREILLLKYDPLKASTESRRAWALTEYETLLATDHVKEVSVVDKTIHIFTDDIKIEYNGNTFNMGRFKIDIFTDGSDSGVKIFNLTKPQNGFQHPHIQKNGTCCLGNISDGVVKLLADYQYVILAQLLISYLQTYNSESAYVRLSNWG